MFLFSISNLQAIFVIFQKYSQILAAKILNFVVPVGTPVGRFNSLFWLF